MKIRVLFCISFHAKKSIKTASFPQFFHNGYSRIFRLQKMELQLFLTALSCGLAYFVVIFCLKYAVFCIIGTIAIEKQSFLSVKECAESNEAWMRQNRGSERASKGLGVERLILRLGDYPGLADSIRRDLFAETAVFARKVALTRGAVRAETFLPLSIRLSLAPACLRTLDSRLCPHTQKRLLGSPAKKPHSV